MGRPARFESSTVLRAAAQETAAGRAVSIARLAELTGMPTGSIYHRFASREELLAETWLGAIAAFHAALLPLLDGASTVRAAEDIALATPRFCREQREQALALVACRRRDFIAADAPAGITDRVEAMNRRVERALAAYAKRIDRTALACQLALVAWPLGAVRLYFPERPFPPGLDIEIVHACRATLSVRRD
jgi:AcrR family transcriptional regulator